MSPGTKDVIALDALGVDRDARRFACVAVVDENVFPAIGVIRDKVGRAGAKRHATTIGLREPPRFAIGLFAGRGNGNTRRLAAVAIDDEHVAFVVGIVRYQVGSVGEEGDVAIAVRKTSGVRGAIGLRRRTTPAQAVSSARSCGFAPSVPPLRASCSAATIPSPAATGRRSLTDTRMLSCSSGS